jgi:hypothetical protein
MPHATYRVWGSRRAGEIIFDTSKVTYRDLMEFFFQIHDPTTLNRQRNDIGTSYRSAIFYTSEGQKLSLKIRLQTLMRRVSGQERSFDRTVSYHRPSTRNASSFAAEGGVRSLGKPVGFAEASLTDAEGRLHTSATSALLGLGRAPRSAKE